jgi:hypothetical protein
LRSISNQLRFYQEELIIMNPNSLLKRTYYVLIVVLPILYLVLNASMADSSFGTKASYPERQKDQIRQETIKVENKTKGVTLVSAEILGDYVNLTLRNDYPMVVTSYEFSIGPVTIHTETLTGADYNDVFPPGTQRVERCSIQPDFQRLGVRILAAILEDGSADGDEQYIREMREYRTGMRMQREQSVLSLRDLLSLDSDVMQAALGNFESESPSISEEQRNRLPYFVRRGFADERERFLRLVRGLKGTESSDSKKLQTNQLDNKKSKILRVIENYSSTLRQL